MTDDEGAADIATRTVRVTDEPGPGEKRIYATGLTRHRCDPDGWTFAVSKAGDAPPRIAVIWADGSRQRVAHGGTRGKSAIYGTTASLDQIATRAWADVPSASLATLELTSGPCF